MDLNISVFLYLLVGIIDTLVYIPLIKKMYHNQYEAIKSNSILTWLWWAFSGMVIFSYMFFVVDDKPTMIISFLNFIACFSIFIMLLHFKIKFKKKENIIDYQI